MKDNKTYKAIKAILLNYRLINPELVSDGYGEFPDAYRMKDTDAEDIATEIININKTERKCEYCLGTGIIENGEECEECDGLGKVWLEESEQEQGDDIRDILIDFIADWYKDNPTVSKEKIIKMADNYLAKFPNGQPKQVTLKEANEMID